MAIPHNELVANLAAKIRNGDYPAGSMLPSLRKLAADYKDTVGSVRKATVELESMGLVRNIPRQGCIVNDLVSFNASKPKNLLVILKDGYLSMNPSLWGTKIFLAIQSECISLGYGVVAKIGSDEANLKSAIAGGLWDNVVGMIGCAQTVDPWLKEEAVNNGIPYILFDAEKARPLENHIMTDHFSSAKLAGTYFCRMGFKNVWVLGQTYFQAAHEALFGLQDAYLDMDMSPHSVRFVRVESFGYEIGEEACSELLAAGEKPDAILACNDHVAMGAVGACIKSGLKVPEDVAVVGATGLDKYQQSSPALTVVSQPMDRMGRTCVQELSRMIATGQLTNPVRRLAGKLIVRDTFMPAKELQKEIGFCSSDCDDDSQSEASAIHC